MTKRVATRLPAPRDDAYEEFKQTMREVATRTHPLPNPIANALRKAGKRD